jgi:AcrR family transcriptional regulator
VPEFDRAIDDLAVCHTDVVNDPAAAPVRRGRPRAVAAADGSRPPRDEIVDAATRLFLEHGYAATSTRAIADLVGVRQPSLYYYFRRKDDILAALLDDAMAPILDAAGALRQVNEPDPVRLYALAASHCAILCSTPHNVGQLFHVPEVQADRFSDFRAARSRLRLYYGMLVEGGITQGDFDALDADVATSLVLGFAESPVSTRASRPEAVSSITPWAVADSCLHVVGCRGTSYEDTVRAGRELSQVVAGQAFAFAEPGPVDALDGFEADWQRPPDLVG